MGRMGLLPRPVEGYIEGLPDHERRVMEDVLAMTVAEDKQRVRAWVDDGRSNRQTEGSNSSPLGSNCESDISIRGAVTVVTPYSPRMPSDSTGEQPSRELFYRVSVSTRSDTLLPDEEASEIPL